MTVSSLAAGRAARRYQPKPDPQPDGEWHERVSDGEDDGKPVDWNVQVFLTGDGITRKVFRGIDTASCWKPWKQFCHAPAGDEGEVIWPTWPGRSQDEAAASPSPLADAQEYWRTVGNRLRDSAKWTAAALGAALATVIGTSPLAGMREHRPQPIAILLGAVGLVFLGVTMLLVLQVMRPQAVSFADVQKANEEEGRKWWLPQAALYKWQTIVEKQQDLYLPCGVKCLTGLRQSMIAEEITLVALSYATGKPAIRHLARNYARLRPRGPPGCGSCGPRLPWSRRSGSTTRCGTAAAGPPTAGSCAACRQRRPSSWPSHGRCTDAQPPARGSGLGARPGTTTGAYRHVTPQRNR